MQDDEMMLYDLLFTLQAAGLSCGLLCGLIKSRSHCHATLAGVVIVIIIIVTESIRQTGG